jgi:6-phosphogluconolactonase
VRLIAALALAGCLHAGTLDVLKRPPKSKYFVYVASKGHGIATYRFDPEGGGALEPLATESKIANPAWLAVHPSNQLLYAVSDDAVTSFAVNAKTGVLRFMNTVPSRGTGGCHIAIEKNGWMLLVTNCTSGNVASFRTAGDGGVGPSMGVQETGHARQAAISPDNFFILVPDADGKVLQYRFNPSEGTFWANNPASYTAKAGPMAFRPDEKFAYVIDEKAPAIGVLRYNRDGGKITEAVESVAAPAGGSAIAVDGAGRFAYVASRTGDSVVVFAIDGKRGTLKQVQQAATRGKGPGMIRIDPSGRYLFVANEASNGVAVFEIERKTGMLAAVGKPIEVASPVCVEFVPMKAE